MSGSLPRLEVADGGTWGAADGVREPATSSGLAIGSPNRLSGVCDAPAARVELRPS